MKSKFLILFLMASPVFSYQSSFSVEGDINVGHGVQEDERQQDEYLATKERITDDYLQWEDRRALEERIERLENERRDSREDWRQ